MADYVDLSDPTPPPLPERRPPAPVNRPVQGPVRAPTPVMVLPAPPTYDPSVYWLVPKPHAHIAPHFVIEAILILIVIVLLLFVTIGKPGPGPGPSPIPVPNVVTAPLHATLVRDSRTPDKSASVLLADAAGLSEALAPLGCKWRAIDRTAALVDASGLGAIADRTGLPALIVQADGQGKEISATKAPATAAEVLAIVRKIRGL